jgi:aspartyl-tRNA(Asn)/glutamyl-tRNA(Gln) amidotransferase subunit A
MNQLRFLTIDQLSKKLQSGQLTKQELLAEMIATIKNVDPKIQALIEVFDLESIISSSSEQGMLAGIPGVVKDNIVQENRVLSCGSKIFNSYRSPYDATVIKQLKCAGGLLLGRANLDEFAMGSSTETSAFFETKNPWDITCVPGGSSGGSAAAVASGMVPWALGSDTGGSVRQPAALCGIVGMKPTYGLVSRYGLVAYASSLDQIGILTRTVRDNALLLSVIAGQDAHDSTTVAQDKINYTTIFQEKLPQGLKIGIVENALSAQGLDNQVGTLIEDAIVQIEKLGIKTTRVSLPTLDYSAAAYFIISRAEAASNLARFDGVRYGLRNQTSEVLYDMYCKTRHDGFGDEVKARILVGNYVLSSGHSGEFYNNAQKVQRLIRKEFLDTFKEVDLLLMPSQPAPAFKIGAFNLNKLQMDLQDYFTCPVNLAGIPAISVPCGFTSENLPVGLQIVGPHFSEQLIYQVAHAYELVTPWHTMHPVT